MAYACVSLHKTDRIRLLKFPEHIIPRVEEAVKKDWPQGIQEAKKYGDSHEIKLHGHPWTARLWTKEKANSRRLVTRVIAVLSEAGWVLKTSVNIVGLATGKDSLIFRYQNPPPPRCAWFSISPSHGDLMHVLDGPPDICQWLVHGFGAMVQSSKQAEENEFVIKFVGYPWHASGQATLTSRLIMLRLMECLEKHGCDIYASVYQDYGDGTGTDSFHCCRPLSWRPGISARRTSEAILA